LCFFRYGIEGRHEDGKDQIWDDCVKDGRKARLAIVRKSKVAAWLKHRDKSYLKIDEGGFALSSFYVFN
jgi:hypothetical protein